MPDNSPQKDDAEAIAVSALAFIASDDVLLPRFLQITGIEAAAIRDAAAEPGFLTGVLQFICAHEPTLLQFCDATDVSPHSVAAAMRNLPQGDDSYQSSI
ncbi:MAG: DUF3572 domain-containing protein [Rhizobiaceae bacterium]